MLKKRLLNSDADSPSDFSIFKFQSLMRNPVEIAFGQRFRG